jgi:hypothetical protein
MRVATKAWKQLIALGIGAGEATPKRRKGGHLVDKFKQGGKTWSLSQVFGTHHVNWTRYPRPALAAKGTSMLCMEG